jgi:cystathionine beta-lyase/cystathionine gamma-synthase
VVKFESKAIHVGQAPDPSTGATVPPIYLTSTYTQEGIGLDKGYVYSRTANPTRAALEECLASLEEGRQALAFASGMAATSAVLSLLKPGDHVLAAEDLYGGTYRLFERVYRPLGICFTYLDGRDPAAFRKALDQHTRIIWAETPTNPLLRLTDLAALAEVARGARAWLVVDNTFATPFFQKPLSLGAHLVVHSSTKYLGGHSDVVGGALVTSEPELYEGAKFYQNAAGAVPSPFDCWLVQRGLKTLAVRMARHESNARLVAEHLRRHPGVEVVHYPGLPDHPQHALARAQMSGYGGMVSFQIRGGLAAVNRFVAPLRFFSFAESLGGVESLVCHPASMTHGSIPEADRLRRGIREGTLRLSVGIEHVDDLIEDLDRALAAAGREG